MRKTAKARSASILAILSSVLLAVQPAFAGSCGSESNIRGGTTFTTFEMRANAEVSSGSDGWWVVNKSFYKIIGDKNYLEDKSDKIIPLSSSARNVYSRDVRNSSQKSTSQLSVTFANNPSAASATKSVTCRFQVETWIHDGRKAHALPLDCAGNQNVTSCDRVYKAGNKNRFEWTIALKP
jgi:hypothetical protein